MAKAIKTFETLSDLYKDLGMDLEQDATFTIHDLYEVHGKPVTSPLFRTNYYSFLLIRGGRGRYIIDEAAYETGPRTLYFTNPGHLKGFAVTEAYHGYIITLSEAFLKQHVHAGVFDDFPFLLAEVVPPHTVSEPSFAVYDELCRQMHVEFNGSSAYKYKILGNLMVVFLLRIKEHFWDDYNPRQESERGSQIVQSFRQDLERYFRALSAGSMHVLPQVSDLAESQGLHPNYLSTVVKAKTGKSVNTWIAEKVIAEAQSLLAHSKLSIKEVAYRLAFQEPTHFSRFFKKHTQLTPSAFRKQALNRQPAAPKKHGV